MPKYDMYQEETVYYNIVIEAANKAEAWQEFNKLRAADVLIANDVEVAYSDAYEVKGDA